MPAATTVVGRRVVGKSGRAARMRNNVCHPVIKSCSARPFRRGRDRNVPSRIRPLPTLPIVSADVPRQFARRGDLSEAQFLYGEVARRMLGRLQYIRLAPRMLDAGCGAGDNLPLLREALSGRGLHRPGQLRAAAGRRAQAPRAGRAGRLDRQAGAPWPGRARLHQWRPGADRPGAGIAGAGLVQPGPALAPRAARGAGRMAARAEGRRAGHVLLSGTGHAARAAPGAGRCRPAHRHAVLRGHARLRRPAGGKRLRRSGDGSGNPDTHLPQPGKTAAGRARAGRQSRRRPPRRAGGPELARPALCGAGSPAPPRRRDRAEHRSGLRPCLAGRRAPRRHRRDAVVGQRHRRTPARNP